MSGLEAFHTEAVDFIKTKYSALYKKRSIKNVKVFTRAINELSGKFMLSLKSFYSILPFAIMVHGKNITYPTSLGFLKKNFGWERLCLCSQNWCTDFWAGTHAPQIRNTTISHKIGKNVKIVQMQKPVNYHFRTFNKAYW